MPDLDLDALEEEWPLREAFARSAAVGVGCQTRTVPPPGEIRRRGTARRRHRAIGLTGAMALTLLAVSAGAQGLLSRPAATTGAGPAAASSAGAARLPMAVGQGPAIQAFTAPGFPAGQYVAGHLPSWEQTPVWGSLHTVATQPSGYRTVLYVTKNAFLCVGDIPVGASHVTRSSCRALDGLPDEGFWGGEDWNQAAQEKSAKDPLIVTGLVRGPVTDVVIHTRTGDVPATLAKPRDPRLGTLYWAVTDIPIGDRSSVDAVRRTAFTVSGPAFACTGSDCTRR